MIVHALAKSMQIELEQGSLDKPLTFNIGLLNAFFILVCYAIGEHTSMKNEML